MKTHILAILGILLAFGQLSAKEIIVERPAFSIRNNDFFEIEKIVLNDKATTLHIKGFADGWIRVANDIYLSVDGKEYPVQYPVNLEFGKQMDVENGERSFSLVFPPIPIKTERFDLCSRAKDWMIWGIELKKPKKNKKTVPGLVPDEFVKAAMIKDDGKHLEAPQWKAADARLTGLFAGYKPEMKYSITVFVDNVITGDQERYPADVNADGTFDLAVPMTITQQVLFRVTYDGGNNIRVNEYIVMSPGEETRICYDLPAFCRKEARLRYDKQPAPKILYFAGANAEINNQYFDADYNSYSKKISDAVYNDNSIAGMTAQEYKEHLLNLKKQCIADINNNAAIILKAKDFFRIDLDYQVAFQLYYIKSNMEDAYKRAHNIHYRDEATGFTPPVLDAEYYSYLKDLPLNDPVSLYFSSYGSAVNGCQYLTLDDGKRQQLTYGILMQRMLDSGKIASEDTKVANYLKSTSPDFWDEGQKKKSLQQYRIVLRNVLDSVKMDDTNRESMEALLEDCMAQESSSFDLHNQVVVALYELYQAGKLSEQQQNTYIQRFLPQSTLDKDVIDKFTSKYKDIISEEVSAFFKRRTITADILGSPEGLLFDLINCREISHSFEDMTPLTEKDFDQLKRIEDPFYTQYLASQNEKLIAKIEYNKSRQDYRANDVQDKENDELFESVIGKEKGKVVLVDFWATWCGPCRSANKQFAPHKSKFDHNKITFIYLTDESSPMDTWRNMIPELSGEHYRLSRSQYDYMKKRLDVVVSGVPSYLVLDKDGNKVFFQTGFPGVNTITGKINEALAK